MALKSDIFSYIIIYRFLICLFHIMGIFFFRGAAELYEENDNSLKAVKTVKEEKLEYERRCSTIDKRKLCENYYVEVLKSGK